MQRKGPLPGKIFARCILRRRFAGRFGCMARISCQSQPVFGRMARESCRELAIFPSEAAFGMHGAQNLPRTAARERISRAFCHRRTPGDASRHNLATTRRPRRTLRAPMRYDTMRHDAMLYDAMLHNAPRCNTMMPCTVRGAFVAAEKVSCGLRVSMR